MKTKVGTVLALLLGMAAAGCSQTTSETAGAGPTKQTAEAAKPRRAATREQRCEEAVQKAAKAHQNAMVAGSVLSVVGGLGGFAGQGGAIVGHAAAVGGSIMQSQSQNQIENAVMKECN